jgi:hypothetical protein
MSKSATKRRPDSPSKSPIAKTAAPASKFKKRTAVTLSTATEIEQNPGSVPAANTVDGGSKRSRVLAMLQAPGGATIAAIMRATGWQPYSVRGFLAGVVRKRLQFKLTSEKINGERIYQIVSRGSGIDVTRASKRPGA